VRLCWGYHAGDIPPDQGVVIDMRGERWFRAGPRSWVERADGPRMHEAWVLEQHGPVRCPTGEQLLLAREEKLTELLGEPDGASTVALPDSEERLMFEDALMLMLAGWLAWSPKQRREALAGVCETEQRELAVTS
jgi:hypothetical protein